VTTTDERRPGVNQGGDEDRGRSVSDDTGPGRLDDDPAFLRVAFRAVDRLVRAAHRLHGPLPAVGTPEWFAAPWITQVATVAVLGEGYILRDPDRIAADQLKAAAVAISEATQGSWRRPSRSELIARRGEIGPLARPFDPVAARRWVETGSSREGAA